MFTSEIFIECDLNKIMKTCCFTVQAQHNISVSLATYRVMKNIKVVAFVLDICKYTVLNCAQAKMFKFD